MATPSVTKKSELNISTQILETSPASTPVDHTPKDSMESLQDKPSSDRSCLTWCIDSICHFFSAIGRFLCNLCGRSPKPTPSASEEPQPSQLDPSSTSSAGNETTAVDQRTHAQPSDPTPETGMSSEPSEPKVEPTPIPPEQHVPRQLPTSADSAPASAPDFAVEKAKEVLLLFPGTEWANKLLEKYEEIYTNNPSKIQFGCFYAGLRDMEYCKPFYTKYTTLEQLQFVHALTNGSIKLSRLSIDQISLRNFVTRIRGDKHITVETHELGDWMQEKSPEAMQAAVAQLHKTIESFLSNYLIKGPS